MLACSQAQAVGATILDTDAYYCTHAIELAEANNPDAELLLLSGRAFRVSPMLTLLSSSRRLTVIDDLNSLYALASGNRGLHQLTVLMRLLSHSAKANGSWVIATAFRAVGDQRQASTKRSVTALGDLLVDTDLRDGSLRLRGEFGRWPADGLRV